MQYQYTVYHYNYETGIKTEGVFKTAAEAQKFKDSFTGHTALDSEMGNKVYGIFESRFNPIVQMAGYDDGEMGGD